MALYIAETDTGMSIELKVSPASAAAIGKH